MCICLHVHFCDYAEPQSSLLRITDSICARAFLLASQATVSLQNANETFIIASFGCLLNTGEEKTSAEELSPSDRPVGVCRRKTQLLVGSAIPRQVAGLYKKGAEHTLDSKPFLCALCFCSCCKFPPWSLNEDGL